MSIDCIFCKIITKSVIFHFGFRNHSFVQLPPHPSRVFLPLSTRLFQFCDHSHRHGSRHGMQTFDRTFLTYFSSTNRYLNMFSRCSSFHLSAFSLLWPHPLPGHSRISESRYLNGGVCSSPRLSESHTPLGSYSRFLPRALGKAHRWHQGAARISFSSIISPFLHIQTQVSNSHIHDSIVPICSTNFLMQSWIRRALYTLAPPSCRADPQGHSRSMSGSNVRNTMLSSTTI